MKRSPKQQLEKILGIPPTGEWYKITEAFVPDDDTRYIVWVKTVGEWTCRVYRDPEAGNEITWTANRPFMRSRRHDQALPKCHQPLKTFKAARDEADEILFRLTGKKVA